MCGIVGIAGYTPRRVHLEGMLDSIRHRGPDGRGTWCGKRFALGHVRLSIIDLTDDGSQPMIDPETGNVLVFNGEIYNYIELRHELEDDYRFRSQSDTEVILAAYRRWGESCLGHLRGMFAFALLDVRAQRLLLARDRLGIKPLYYRQENGFFLFGSEIKALLGVVGLPHSPNLDRIVEFLAARHQDSDETTFFAEVHQILPGYCAWVDSDGTLMTPRCYWSADDHFGERPFDAQVQGEFTALLRDTMRLHLRSDVPVGAFVSGGLDSSTVACIAAEQAAAGSLHTYSSVLEHKNEENALIPHIQRKVGGPNHEIQLDGADFLEVIPRLIEHQDEPIADASMYAHYMLCEAAHNHGVKVLLSGNGGDEIFGGYQCHIYAYLGHLLRLGQIGRLRTSISELYANRGERRFNLCLRAIQEAAPLFVRNKIKRNGAHPMLAHTHLSNRLRNFNYYYDRNTDPWRANFINCISHWTVPPFLHYEDRNSMAFGVEVRVPLLDHKVVEFAQTIAPDFLVSQRSKMILRDSMRGIVPDPVLDQRTKQAFAAPLDLFLRRNVGRLREVMPDLLRDIPFLDHNASMRLSEDVIDAIEGSSLNWAVLREAPALSHVKQSRPRWSAKDVWRTGFVTFWRTYSLATWYKTFFGGKYAPISG